jgi:hypothetical protein
MEEAVWWSCGEWEGGVQMTQFDKAICSDWKSAGYAWEDTHMPAWNTLPLKRFLIPLVENKGFGQSWKFPEEGCTGRGRGGRNKRNPSSLLNPQVVVLIVPQSEVRIEGNCGYCYFCI